jgi:hypothetical protein
MFGVERFMNVTGNHDVGYAGELNPERLGRWETHFGHSNFVYTLNVPGIPIPLRVVLFNTLNLDSPATDADMQHTTHSFLRSLLPDDEAIPQTILLTHLPLYRGAGICSDAPRFEYWSLNITDDMGNVTGYFRPIKHQNHLSRWASDWILETIFGDEDEGIILGGHDHEGCDVLHRRLSDEEREEGWDMNSLYSHDELRKRADGAITLESKRDEDGVEIAREEKFDQEYEEQDHELLPLEISQQTAHLRNNLSEGIWKAEKYTPKTSGIREITVRSMMGEFHGNVGLLTATYNPKSECTLLVSTIIDDSVGI